MNKGWIDESRVVEDEEERERESGEVGSSVDSRR